MIQNKENNVLVRMVNVTKKYGKKLALKNVNLEIFQGEQIGIIGANGSGKSTLVEIIASIRKPSLGEIWKKPKMVVGIQFQDSKYPTGISVQAMIEFYLKSFNIKYSEDELDNLLKTYKLTDLKKKLINDLSGGQQQRVNLLVAVIHQPEFLVLDEVSTGLDIEAREDIFSFLEEKINNEKITLVLVTHIMSEIEKFCQKVIFLHDGEIKEQTTVKEIVAEYGTVDAYTREKFKFYKNQTEIKQKILVINKKNGDFDEKKD